MIQVTNEEHRKLARYDSLLWTYQQVITENAIIKEELLRKDKVIDHLQKLLITPKRPY